MNFLLLSYFLLFFYLGLKNFKISLWLFLLFLPVYFIPINVFGLTSNLLEVTFFALFFSWLPMFFKNDWRVVIKFIEKNKFFSIATFIFLGVSFIAALNNQFFIRSFGHWRAYFLEPVVLFWILISQFDKLKTKDLLRGVLFASLPVSLLSIFQMITGKFIYTPEWSTLATRRVTAFFTSPNAVALFLEMILILAGVYFLFLKKEGDKKEKIFVLIVFILAGLAILFSFSQGAWLALFTGLLFLLVLSGYKKILIGLVVVSLVISFFVPSVQEVVSFADKSGQNRLFLWKKTGEYLISSPKRFIFGTGLRRFYGEIQKPFANVVMEPLIYPHNIILNFWSETGLFGLLTFIFIYLLLLKESWLVWKNKKIFGMGLLVAWLVFFIHGLVDVPYFKNDLSFLFWVFAALVFYLKTELIKKENV